MSVWGGESIHNAVLSQLTSAPSGKKIAKFAFTWNADGTVATIKAYDGDGNLLFTLTFTWNADGTLSQVART
jgi:hypothetical protein